MRRLAACLAMVVLLAQGWTGGPVRTAAAAPTEKNCPVVGNKIPVILVHGWNSGKTVWQTGGFSPKLSGLSGVFVDDQFDYSSDSSQWVTKDSIAPALARRVMHLARCSAGQGGHGKVVLVGHSMGGLAIRCAASQECSKVPGVADKISLVVTMGTPNLGAWIRGNKFASYAEQVLLEEIKAGCQWRKENGPGFLLGATSSILPICPLVGEAAGPAGVAFTEGSRELENLPWLPEREKAVPVLALAAHKRLTVTLFTKTLTFNDNVGDMVVNQKSAEQDVREINSLGGKAVIDCGTYDFTLQGMFSTCWHGSEVSNSEFQQRVYDEIEKLTRSLDLPDVRSARPLTRSQILNASIPAGSCGDSTDGWKQPVPIQLHNGTGVARFANGSFAGSSMDQAKVLGFADFDRDGHTDVALQFTCFGSTPDRCCAGRDSRAAFIDVLAIESNNKLRLIGRVIRGGASKPGDQYGPASRNIKSASLSGTTITTLEYIVYPDQYTPAQVGGRDPNTRVTVEHRYRNGQWVTN
jgi:pimeloyl-ACP methyl ester carboxylesterase